MRTKGTLVATALLSPCMPVSLANAVEHQYLEPNVQRHVGVLPPSVCKRLIDLGEESGFLVVEESIDEDEQNDPTKKFVPSQTIDIYDKGSEPGTTDTILIENENIWNVLRPWIPSITKIVKTNRGEEFSQYYPDEPDRKPDLNWVFFRKYSPRDERNSLTLHHDTNMNTVNIEMSDDYVGGGLFYIKPLATTGEISDDYYEYDDDYEWIDSLKRENTTDIIFPDLHTGDAIFYNYTVEHGVAPVESGTRYSMAFFFDMDNPAVREDFDDDDSEDNSEDVDDDDMNMDDDDTFKVELYNEFPGVELDVLLVYDVVQEKEVRIRVFDKMRPYERTIYHAVGGDILRAFFADTDKVVSDIEIKRDQSLCTVYQLGFFRSAGS
mmetsp:Transcript_21233/g.39014  ORF Transcript_21233/g.39014 Transcript_21233/m.39014 type:complete len:380 (+) Transcript_21233:26-1165(+)